MSPRKSSDKAPKRKAPFHYHMPPDCREIADRRSCETDRCNITAYISRLIREDGDRHPKTKKP
jgi:hypothetical protein